MTNEIIYVLGVATMAGVLFVSGRVRTDLVALLVALSLVLGRILTVPEALAGFGNPVVIVVAGLLVISNMLTRTGVAHQIGNWLARYGRDSETRLLLLLILAVSILGCFMSNTAVVAIFIPVVLSVANKTNLNASRLLMPMAYAGLISGMFTLIATTSNLVVSAELERSGFEPFSFFSFTPIGVTVACVFVVYILLVGRHLLPGERFAPPKTATRNMQDLLSEFEMQGTAHRFQVQVGSPLVGKTLAESEIGSLHNVWVFILERPGRLSLDIMTAPSPDVVIRGGDVLVIYGPREASNLAALEHKLASLPVTATDRARWLQETGIAKVLIHPESRLIGRTLRKIGLHKTYGVQVLGLQHKNEIRNDFLDREIHTGDAMLVIGPWKRIQQLQSELFDFVVLTLPIEIDRVAPAWQRAPVALGILALLVLLSALKIVPVVIAVLICGLLAVITRCMTMEQAYIAINWSSVVLIAGMLSVVEAMTKTGAIEFLSESLVTGLGNSGPHLMMAALFLATALLGMFLSSTASAILCTPIAIQAASALGVAPHPFAMSVAIAASAAFIMPVSTQTVLMVVGPGKYRLVDFFKVGIPLFALTWLVAMLLIPPLFPFHP